MKKAGNEIVPTAINALLSGNPRQKWLYARLGHACRPPEDFSPLVGKYGGLHVSTAIEVGI
jgi:hypothetical protein